MKRAPLKRSTKPIRRRSVKMQNLYRKERVPLVKKMLAEDETGAPALCVRCGGVATEVDEIVGRGRGGSFVDEANCQRFCNGCHRWKTDHPAQATEEGWLKSNKQQFSTGPVSLEA